MLAAKVYSLHTGSPDTVNLSFILNANTRHGIAYSRTGPQSLPSTYSINTATSAGIQCGGVGGAWITVPSMVFYGAAGLAGEYYNKVWVSSNGYISVFGDSNVGSVGPGVIAAFSRQLDPCPFGGHVWDWLDGMGGFLVAWDNMASCYTATAGGTCVYNSESFLLHVHSITDFAYSLYGESGIEFWYSSVTPGDKVQTGVGIADQYGTRAVSINPASLNLNNQRFVFTASSGYKYLNSLSVTLTATSSGSPDSAAQVVFDPSTNPAGNPFGYNILVNPTGPPTIPYLDYARTALGAAGLVVSTAAAAGLIEGGLLWADPAVGAVVLGLDTYNTLVQDYRNAQSLTESLPGTNPASMHAWAAQDGFSSPNQTPVDASLAGKAIWTFTDTSPRYLPHHLTLTATVGYTDVTYQRNADTYTVTDTVQLDINPDYNLIRENFDSGSGNFGVAWSHTGTWQVASCPLTGIPACTPGQYFAWSGSQSNEVAPLIWNIGSFVNYAQIVVYLHFWVDLTGGIVGISYLSQGKWIPWTTYTGQMSTSGARAKTAYTQWINARLVMPPTATAISFTYNTGSTSPPGQGFYMQDLYLFGDGPTNNADVTVNGQLTTSTVLPYSVPISMDGGPYYYTTDHFLETLSTHTLTAQALFTDNAGTYSFAGWLDGVASQSRTITVPSTGFIAKYSIVPDFTVTSNSTTPTILQGSSQGFTIYVNSRNGFSGSVTVTAYPPTSVSGITASPSPEAVSVTTSQASYPLTIAVGKSVPTGQYMVTVTGTATSGIISLSSSVSLTVTVTTSSGSNCCSGSVAAGTMIVLANATQVPVQSLAVGMQLLSYDTTTNRFVSTTVARFATVETNNIMIIETSTGNPLIVDQNPAQKLYVMFPNGTRTMLSVTSLQVGYSLFNVPTMSWVQITSIKYQTGGNHVMYDIFNTSPGNYIANGYLDPQKQ
jgi:hypothetical protein